MSGFIVDKWFAGDIKDQMFYVGLSQGKVFKIPKLPTFGLHWEKKVMDRLEEKCNIPNFCKAISLEDIKSNYSFDTFGYTTNNVIGLPNEILWTENVGDTTVFEYISKKGSRDDVLFIICQVLSALHIAQKRIRFCHYDLHFENVILQKDDRSENGLFFVYDFDDDYLCVPVVQKAAMIDFQHSFCDVMENETFDVNIDIIRYGCCSSLFNENNDVLRFISTVVHEYKSKNPNDDYFDDIVALLKNYIISDISGLFRYLTYPELKSKISDNERFKRLKSEPKEFISVYMADIRALLSHRIRLPFKEKVDVVDVTSLVILVERLIQLQVNDLKRIYFLKMMILYDDWSSFKEGLPTENAALFSEEYYNECKKLINDTLPNLETCLYHETNLSLGKMDLVNKCSPKDLLDYINENKSVVRPVTKKSVLVFVSPDYKKEVSLDFMSDKDMEEINQSKTMKEFTRKLMEKIK